MNKKWKVVLSVSASLLIGGVWFVTHPVDIRPPTISQQISGEAMNKGQTLMTEMMDAYGGIDEWLAFQTGSYSQVADWYDDKLGIAGWDEQPQKFVMTSFLGTDNSEITLLNGENKGQTWGVENWKSYQLIDSQKKFKANEKYHHKLIYKNYWFQFPFRISEAEIIAFAGERTVDNKTYDLLFATWGSQESNSQFDQYVLYLDKETKLIERLHFTLRDKASFLHIAAQFTDFKPVNGITVPFTQYIRMGRPGSEGPKMHENRYQWIKFGKERVFRSKTKER